VLLSTPGVGDAGWSRCVDLLLAGDASETSVLWVSYTRSATGYLADWRDGAEAPPAEMALLVPGEQRGPSPDGVTVETVGSPSDLTGLGIAIRRHLEEWEPPITVCFDSLTSLLQYVDLETAFEFLHVLSGQLYAAGAVAHFHLDPSAHEERTVTMLETLVDAVVTVQDDGGVEIRRRRIAE